MTYDTAIQLLALACLANTLGIAFLFLGLLFGAAR